MRVVLGVLMVVTATPAAAERLSAQGRRGRDVLKAAQCNRCHHVTDPAGGRNGVRAAPHFLNCTKCHERITRTRGDDAAVAKFSKRYPDWPRWLRNLQHFIVLPDLGTITRRVDPKFVREFLDAPFDLRPHLEETMIPVRLDAAQKDDLVAYLAELSGSPTKVKKLATPPKSRIEEGRKRFAKASCPSCHVLGNVRVNDSLTPDFYRAMRSKNALAPNLRFVRERMSRDTLIRWIKNPTDIDPKATMYKQTVKPEDVGYLADYILHGDPQLHENEPKPKTPTPRTLSRKVTYDEVREKIFGVTCRHCHEDPETAKDPGSGSAGGLGFKGVGLTLSHYAGIQRGMVLDGKRVSVLEPQPGGEPPILLAAVLRRHVEATRDFREPYEDHRDLGTAPGERPGMPLALPPLTVDQLSLLKTWLDQGAPGPVGEEKVAPSMGGVR